MAGPVVCHIFDSVRIVNKSQMGKNMSDVSQDVKKVSSLALAVIIGMVVMRLVFSGMTMLTLGSAGRELANQE